LKRLLIVLLLALATWLSIYKVASAQETNEPAQFINYEKFHKKTEKPIPEPTITHRTLLKKVSENPPEYSGRNYSKEEVIQLIIDYSAEYRIKSDTPLCIANKESGYNQFSANRNSSAKGVFQYLASTWLSTDEGKSGLSVFDADANIKAAVKFMAIHRSTQPWVTRSSCPPLKFIN
jgi:hypothetical protein